MTIKDDIKGLVSLKFLRPCVQGTELVVNLLAEGFSPQSKELPRGPPELV